MPGVPRFVLRSGSTTIARLASVGTLLVVMAVGARRFTTEQFGIWTILYALMNFALTIDFGFRFALGNRLAALGAAHESSASRKATFFAVFHLETVVAAAGALVCWFGLTHVSWDSVFHIRDQTLAYQINWVFPAVCALFLLNQPFTLAATAFFADHQVELASAFSVLQSAVLIVVFCLAAYTLAFPAAVAAFFVAYLGTGVAFTLFLLVKKGWTWTWAPLRSQWSLIGSLSGPALDFFALSICATTATTIGPLLAGTIAGAQSAGDFSLLQRLFNLMVAIHLAALAPLAPSYTAHAQRGEWDWVRSKLSFCIRVIWPILFLAGCALIVAAHPYVLRVWSGRVISDYPLAALLAAAAVMAGWGNTYSILLNSLGAVRYQAALAAIMIAPVILLPAYLGKAIGLHGVALASCLTAIPGSVFVYIYANRTLAARRLRI